MKMKIYLFAVLGALLVFAVGRLLGFSLGESVLWGDMTLLFGFAWLVFCSGKELKRRRECKEPRP